MDARTQALWNRHAAELPRLSGYPLQSMRFAAGDTLAGAGEPLTRLGFVVEGRATVHNAMENGRAVLLREYRGVQTVGEVELLLGGSAHLSQVRATTRGAMLCIPLESGVRERICADAALLYYLAREVADKLAHSSRIASQDRLYPARARLAAYLLYQACEGGGAQPLTRVAELLGVSYRHLLRTLRWMQEAGLVAREGRGCRVLDAQALRSLAGEIRYD